MGHYASEMGVYDTEEYHAEETRRRRWQGMGFTKVNSYSFGRDALECGKCGAVVLDFDKHHEFHKKEDE